MTILIPAYEPNDILIDLIKKIKLMGKYNIVIINDGSSKKYDYIFKEIDHLGGTVISYDENKGKGYALKTGFKYIQLTNENEGVVTADCDGQHLPEDIIKIANEVKKDNKSIMLGTRHFIGKVPLRSRFGNFITRLIFSFTSGVKIYDTQTGLRGFSREMLDWLCSIKGDRYDYEMNVLLEGAKLGYNFQEISIDTVYLNNNESSHFNPLKDSISIYLPILKFSFSSIISALIDFMLLIIINHISNNLLLSVVLARACSSTFNYLINKFYVFNNTDKVNKTSAKYFMLVIILLIMNYFFINIYTIIGLSLVLAKILTEVTLFLLSFKVQKKFIF